MLRRVDPSSSHNAECSSGRAALHGAGKSSAMSARAHINRTPPPADRIARMSMTSSYSSRPLALYESARLRGSCWLGFMSVAVYNLPPRPPRASAKGPIVPSQAPTSAVRSFYPGGLALRVFGPLIGLSRGACIAHVYGDTYGIPWHSPGFRIPACEATALASSIS